jgi:hypothetical protein
LFWSKRFWLEGCLFWSNLFCTCEGNRKVQCCQMVYFRTKKNPSLVKFWMVLEWKMLVFLEPFCLLYGQMVYFIAVWYILWSIGIFLPALVYCTKKNLATLVWLHRGNWDRYYDFLNIFAEKFIENIGVFFSLKLR